MEFDLTDLVRLGKRHTKLREELDELRPHLAEEIRAAHVCGVPQIDIVKASGYTRDQVRQICLPPERKRTRVKATS